MICDQQVDNELTSDILFDYLFDTMRKKTSEPPITTGSRCFRVEEWKVFQDLGGNPQKTNLQEIS